MAAEPVEPVEVSEPVLAPEITSVQALDAALGELTGIDAQLNRIEATRTRAIARVNNAANKRREALDKERAAWVAAIAEYCRTRKSYLRGRFGRTIKLTHGVIEWRWSPLALEVDAERMADAAKKAAALNELIELIRSTKGWRRFIRIRYELNKDALKKHPRFTNRLPGVRRTQHEDLRIKPHKVKSPLLAEGRPIVVRGKARKN